MMITFCSIRLGVAVALGLAAAPITRTGLIGGSLRVFVLRLRTGLFEKAEHAHVWCGVFWCVVVW